ncbi:MULTISPECIES: GNAT family N-acetyltransferase [unclassified Phenylobacterium]|jgi:N-acetyltransferase|uniref:GNAT family N-acetyltransferase n=1 Tax=unclassified Phenylobacterium TaxID=2640670 RepID=UPI000839F98E|nr:MULTISPECIES: GNAT family protein [unclassified Phenylobacterium]
MKLEPKLLENRFVRLEPMTEAHREGLRAATNADQRIWTELYPFSWAGEHFEPTWAKLMGDQAAGNTQAYAVVAGGEVVGLTTFYAIDPPNSVLEVGGTYYRPDARGGAVNPAAKRMMMAHAFDSGARRVVYRVDALNARSRAAVTKLGAVQEGILRADRLTWTGRIRDTVIFSILADEWPGVRDRLDARLAALAG